mmetsp:Transcript_32175/g.91293  ORF Transcript_32175/g.91293 Transcript_32175/m.91293 type:complete len:110 (+) Transcript_32175:244-573(+)
MSDGYPPANNLLKEYVDTQEEVVVIRGDGVLPDFYRAVEMKKKQKTILFCPHKSKKPQQSEKPQQPKKKNVRGVRSVGSPQSTPPAPGRACIRRSRPTPRSSSRSMSGA